MMRDFSLWRWFFSGNFICGAKEKAAVRQNIANKG
jgi:hypothetical protein